MLYLGMKDHPQNLYHELDWRLSDIPSPWQKMCLLCSPLGEAVRLSSSLTTLQLIALGWRCPVQMLKLFLVHLLHSCCFHLPKSHGKVSDTNDKIWQNILTEHPLAAAFWMVSWGREDPWKWGTEPHKLPDSSCHWYAVLLLPSCNSLHFLSKY